MGDPIGRAFVLPRTSSKVEKRRERNWTEKKEGEIGIDKRRLSVGQILKMVAPRGMSFSSKGPGSVLRFDGKDLRIGIVNARWNNDIIDLLLAGAKKALKDAGVKDENIVIQTVPGSYELPLAVTGMANAGKTAGAPFDAIIAIGALIKGHTMHFEYIADAVSHGLMRVQIDTGCPVIFGLLTLLNAAQGMERAGADGGHNHGEDWGYAAVELGSKRRAWGQGKFV
ncbi:6,7-dimethyl-8-ribityllumazine synthase [Piedraia hortae CBS 480.64]|uniref:6,7-dimethyl-8-ribityllumazine synthase n=1 Tax=Piedraia hortae CBS 480.64 TaxID=1314780 RepID=A0A6A7C105_9PEZI|nr:6,7-dimethyl-8-ribityllumazine synthase [Piedraia hortae CBS 480.64]